MVEGLIFENVEIVEDFPIWCKKIATGLDFGFTHDPSAAIRCGVIDNELYLDELFYRTHMLASDLIRELKPYSGLRIVSDSADPRLIQEIRNGGINIYPAEKGQGSVMAGIAKMLEMKIKVTRRSVNLLKEFRNYTYLQDKDGKWLNEPIDAYNHGIDAARYYVLGVILGKIKQPKNYEGYF
jgi:phage terminase large subunit